MKYVKSDVMWYNTILCSVSYVTQLHLVSVANVVKMQLQFRITCSSDVVIASQNTRNTQLVNDRLPSSHVHRWVRGQAT